MHYLDRSCDAIALSVTFWGKPINVHHGRDEVVLDSESQSLVC